MRSMRTILICIWIFLLTTSVSSKWWGRLIPPFLKRNNAKIKTSKLSAVSAAGLRNLGNTCYMNSVLQSLFYSIPYRRRVMNSSFIDDSVGEKLSWLFEEMEGSEYVDTFEVANALNLNVGTQEDAQEFLLRLINEIDSSVFGYNDRSVPPEEPASNIFKGFTEQTIKCTNIDFSKRRQQKFLDLTVDILGHDHLGSALKDMFTKPDYLTGENQYRVPKGTGNAQDDFQDAEKRLCITELPDMLCLTLKRFTFDVSTSSMMKIGDILEFPLDLNMKPYYSPSKALTSPASKDSNKLMGKEKILDRKDGKKETSSESIIRNGKSVYQLSSIIVHEGSADFGHYICFARPNLNTNPNLWLKLNDKTVTETDFKNVCEMSFGSKNSEKNSRNAYLLFYTRKSN